MKAAGNGRVLALCGGVGGAKLALGLSRILPAEQLLIIVNTGDDFEHMGLFVCPDLDTVAYTLSGLNNPETGWGRKDESWQCLETLEQLGSDTWFQLGDRDLGLHLTRRALLDRGMNLSEVTGHITKKLGIACAVAPMSDDPVRTVIETEQGELTFQDYFVKQRCLPVARSMYFDGVDNACPSAAFKAALDDEQLEAILICPSNPFVSIAPILALPGVVERLRNHRAPVVAVSPIVASKAIKGPTAKMMLELGLDCSALGVFLHYSDLLDGFVMDEQDQQTMPMFPKNTRVHCCNTVMRSLQDRQALATECIDFARSFLKPGTVGGRAVCG